MPRPAQDLTSVRAATPSDVPAIARIHRAAFSAALPWIPTLHTPEEDTAYFRELVTDQLCFVAEAEGTVLGFAAWRDGWLNQLYVQPEMQNAHVGSRLLHQVTQHHQSVMPTHSLALWTFQRNQGARRFYERQGFEAVEFTDGSSNEEHEPDVRYTWRSTQ